MPYNNDKRAYYYNKGYGTGYRTATRHHLGDKCSVCGSTENLEIHHKNGLNRKSRTLKDLENIFELELKCRECHNGVK